MPALLLKTPLEPEKVALLRALVTATAELEISYFLVGATARDILMHYQFEFPIRRASLDIDLAVAMNDWNAYEAFKKHLLRAPQFQQDATRQYRLIYTVQGADPLWADLIPFGGVEHLPDTIAWPPDLGVLMNVACYDEALQAAIQVQIAADRTISVASIPGLVMTKIVAWNDRRSSTSKDALDIAYLLGNYADAGNIDRLYGEDIFVLEDCGYDIARAGARLLGPDIVAIASAETCATLLAILEDEGRFESLVLGAASHRYLDEASGDAVRRQFQELVVGLKLGNASV